MKKTIQLISTIILCNLAGILGSLFTFSQIDTWYANLSKPFFNPPSWVFGPVWTILYILMGIALYLIWQEQKSKKRNRAMRVFFFQLFLNAIWTPIFFGWHQIGLALFVIFLLFVSIVWTMRLFFKQSKTAAYLLIPYLGWVGFATILNASLYVLN